VATWTLVVGVGTLATNEIGKLFSPTSSGELDVPWSDRNQWPNECQLQSQFPGPPGSNYDVCTYICKGWGPKTPINTTVPKGGTCEKWHDWVPVPHP
jgi:hypothetical protein